MTTAAPTKRARTRSGLLVALQELLLDPDVPTVSVPQVVGRVGAAQGTFYNYFDSLPEAVDAVGALILIEHTRVLQIVTAGAANPAEIVARSARQTLMMLVHRPEVGRLIFDSGACLDLHRGLLTADAVPDVVGHLLHTLGVSPGTAQRIINAPQEFVQWAPIPLHAVEEV